MADDAYFQTRFASNERREVLWRTLCRYYFSHLISPEDCVLELGAGYGFFINGVKARRRFALDAWPGFLEHLDSGVEGRVGDVTDLAFLPPSSVNFVFASNLFEHVSQDQLASVLGQLQRAMTPDGTLNILQPNYYYCYREYFDDYTHRTVYTHTSLTDFLEAHQFEVIECHPRFLPLTLTGGLPVSPVLIRMYLSSPWKPLGKQMFLRARRRR